jgi:hypothetical protein
VNQGYRGITQPTWWYTGTATNTSTLHGYNLQQQRAMQDFGRKRKAAPKSAAPETAVDWLRGRVREICDLAPVA